ncbi:MAG TPA: DUF1800 family protein [Bryobacteraceae bacterium]|nr:DUF1800 family protein [Bryobacteraceae bacterium]
MVRSIGRFYIGLGLVLALQAATPPVAVSPSSANIRGGAAVQFSVTLTGVNDTIVWSVNGVAGGTVAFGKITTTGLYTAPTGDPGTPLKIRGALTNTPATFSEAALTWLSPTPVITSLTPTAVNVGTFTVMLNGTGFVTGSVINLNDTPQPTKFISTTQLSFQATITTPETVSLTVTNPNPGGATSGARSLQIMPPVSLTITPTTANVRAGTTQKFTPHVSNAVDHTVVWSVNGVPGGTAATGTIASDGTYTPPPVPPANNAVEIEAASVADPTATAKAQVTLLNPAPAILSTTPQKFAFGTQTITVDGSGFVPTSVVQVEGRALITTFVSSTRLTASANIAPTPGELLTVTVANPAPGPATSAPIIVPAGPANPAVSYLAAARFLEQATWGPDAASIAHVQAIGFDAWITEQLAATPTLYKSSTSSSNSLVDMQSAFFVNGVTAPDQLRQRVAFALSQIFVVSGLKTGEPRQMVPFQNLLIQDAFSTYPQALRDVTLSPTMGVYLDMVNNDKANAAQGTAPNENYAREVMQLFSLGTALLNPDGSNTTNPPTPTYTQDTITQNARALTGWTFPGHTISSGHNPENYTAPMIAVESNHDTSPKTIVGGIITNGNTEQDLDAVLNALSTHQNTAPFISLRLIQHLVTGNPSPQYVARISGVFKSTNGNLAQVVRAILLDPEARQGDDPNAAPITTGGHLREPVLYLLNMLRALQATVVTQNPIESLGSDMGQEVFYAPSVFNYYSPLFRTATGLLAPEFQLLSSSSALVRANAVQSLVSNGLDGDAHFNLAPFTALASSPNDLVTAIDNTFLYGRLPAALKADIVQAITATNDSGTRVRNAIYLVATSSLYQVQH